MLKHNLLYTNVHSSTIHSSQKMETIQISINWLMNKQNVDIHTCSYACMLNHVQLFVIAQTVDCQAPQSTGFSRQEYWSGLPFPPPGYLPDPGIRLCLLNLLHWSRVSITEPPEKLGYPYNELQLSHKKEWSIDMCYNMHELQTCCMKAKWSQTQKASQCMILFIWNILNR